MESGVLVPNIPIARANCEALPKHPKEKKKGTVEVAAQNHHDKGARKDVSEVRRGKGHCL